MKRILIATDFSIDSRHTLDWVIDLIQSTQTPCSLLLVNTYKIHQTNAAQVIQNYDEIKRRSKEGLELEREEVLRKMTNPLITVKVASHLGSLHNVIHQLIESEQIDLVAIPNKDGNQTAEISASMKNDSCALLITSLNNKI